MIASPLTRRPADGTARFLDTEAFGAWVMLRAQPRQAGIARRMVRRFLWHARAPDPAELSAGDVASHLADLRARGLSLKTIHNHRSAISQWFEFIRERGDRATAGGADRRGGVKGNPALAVRLGRPPKRLPRYLDEGDLRQLLEASGRAGCWPEIVLALSTGFRLSELTHLQWADVDVGRKMLAVRRAKNGRPRMESLSPAALEALRRQRDRLVALGYGDFLQIFPARKAWRSGTAPGGFEWRYEDRPRCETTWRNLFAPIQAAVPKFTAGAVGCGRAWHLLRHTFASRLAQANVGDRRIAALLGHSDVRSVDVYAHLRPDAYDPAVELAAPPLGNCGFRISDCGLGPAGPGDDWEI